MKALVTGGGGFLGRYIVEQLVGRGNDVRVFSRQHYRELEPLGVEALCGDLRDRDAVAAAVAGVDMVFHVAAVPGVWGPWRHFYEINTLGTQHVIDACRRHAVPRLVYTSSPSVVYDGRPHCGADESLPYPDSYLCHYPHTKALAERAVLAANAADLSTVALRPHLIWGPRDNHLIPRLIRRARAGRLRRVGEGTNLISMSYVENVADAHLLAADSLSPEAPHAGRAYFVNEPEPVRMWEWIDELLQRAGLAPLKRTISPGTAHRVGAVCEFLFRLVGTRREPPMTRFVAAQLSSSHFYSVAAAQRDFGYRTLVPVDEGMRRLEPELRQLAQA